MKALKSGFGGEVVSIMVLSPVNKAVMIQHGDYFTISKPKFGVCEQRDKIVSNRAWAE
jgi:hypothetical protein